MTRLIRLGRGSIVLVRHLLRLTPWPHLLVAGIVAVVATAVNDPITDDPLPEMVDALRVAMVPLAIGVAFTLDDPVDRWLATPVPLASRRWIRVATAVAAVAGLWVAVLAATDLIVGLPGGLPAAMLTTELGTLVAITLAAAAVGGRWLAGGAGGIVGATTVLIVAAVQLVLPARWSLFVPYRRPPQSGGQPTEGRITWVLAHQHWAWIGLAAVVVLMVASSDPARRSLRQLVGTDSEPAAA